MDIASVLFDSELGYASFVVEQITYTRGRDGTSSNVRTEQVSGCIHPGTAETLKLLPEEERNDTFIVIYTDYVLSAGIPEDIGAVSFNGADRIHWNNRIWRVVKVRDWQGFGFVQALAVLMQEEE